MIITKKKLDAIEWGSIGVGGFAMGAILGLVACIQEWVGRQRVHLRVTHTLNTIQSALDKELEKM